MVIERQRNSLYRKVLKLQPQHLKALRLSALLAHEFGDIEEAERFLNAAVRHSPEGDLSRLTLDSALLIPDRLPSSYRTSGRRFPNDSLMPTDLTNKSQD